MPLTRSTSAANTTSTASTTNTTPAISTPIVATTSSVVTTQPPVPLNLTPVTTSSLPSPPAPPARRARMSLPAKSLEKQIRPFDGNKSKLSEFLSTCETSLRLVDPAEKTILFELIKLKLTDKAYQATRFREFATFAELKLHLNELFGDKQSRQRLETTFYSSRQGQNEDVMHFADRVETNLYKLIENVTPTLDATFQETHRQQLEIQAKNVFINGIRDPLALLLKARNPNTLQEAIGLAVTEERELNSRKELFRGAGPSRPTSNGNYNNRGHQTNCTNHKPGNQNSGKPFNGNFKNPGKTAPSHFSSPSTSNGATKSFKPKQDSSPPRKSRYDENAFCTFCRIKGHDVSVCRSKKRAEAVSTKSYYLNSNRGVGNHPG